MEATEFLIRLNIVAILAVPVNLNSRVQLVKNFRDPVSAT